MTRYRKRLVVGIPAIRGTWRLCRRTNGIQVITEREHWLSITNDPHWKRNHITDPNISLDDTIDALVAAFPAKPGSILEIGCGYGRLLSVMSDIYPDAALWGTDVNPAVLSEVTAAETVCADTLADLPAMDVVYSVALFQHLPVYEKRRYINEAFDVLNPGGAFRVQFIEGVRDNFCDHWIPEDQMVGWFKAAGFDVTVQTGLAHPQWTWITGTK